MPTRRVQYEKGVTVSSQFQHRNCEGRSRRDFLSRTLLSGIMFRPAIFAGGVGDYSAGASRAANFGLEELTLAELQEGMSSGKFSARSITEKYLSHIEAIDRRGPRLRSIIELNAQALKTADMLDRERKTKGPRSLLHGVPVLLKDNIEAAGGMKTTAGSLALAEFTIDRDAFITQKLRNSGAIILGKTNLSEWANFRSSHSSSGWSGRGGQTLNPYSLDRNPCGSSSGSGAAVTANLAMLAVGTETDGSIVCPSSANGIVGIKPTLGLISRRGIIPIAHSQDTAGPMGRTVRDAAILLGILAGIDSEDPVTQECAGKLHLDYTKFLDPKGLAGSRIGVARNYFGFNQKVDALMENCLTAMKQAGAILIDPANLENTSLLEAPEMEVLLFEFKADLNAYLSSLGLKAPVHSLKELIDFNEQHREEEMAYFGQDLFLKAEAKGPLSDPAYRKALEACRRLSRTEGIDAVMNRHQLDALVAPTGGPCWKTDLINGDHSSGGSSTQAAVAGYPNINVPAGQIFGLPVGISFFGRAYSEPTLLRLAYAFEQITHFRRPPQFLPSTASLFMNPLIY
jgi:amidase